MPAAVDSAFDVAFYFADMALNENEFLQPQKLHRLLFLSQAYYAVANDGAKLMPAVFVAEEQGPVEPSIYKAFSKGRPSIEVDLFLPAKVETFLNDMWMRFGQETAERLKQLTMGSLAYRQALKRGRRAEISLESMRNSFTRKKRSRALDQGSQPKLMRTQSGRAVKVKAWSPGAKPSGK